MWCVVGYIIKSKPIGSFMSWPGGHLLLTQSTIVHILTAEWRHWIKGLQNYTGNQCELPMLIVSNLPPPQTWVQAAVTKKLCLPSRRRMATLRALATMRSRYVCMHVGGRLLWHLDHYVTHCLVELSWVHFVLSPVWRWLSRLLLSRCFWCLFILNVTYWNKW